MTGKITFTLDNDSVSKRTEVLILDHKNHKFLPVEVSTATELIDCDYKDLLNPYMIFYINVCAAIQIAKKKKQFRHFSDSFKDIPHLWEIAPKDVKDTYDRLYIGYRKLKPKTIKFVSCNQNLNDTNPETQSGKTEEIVQNLITQSEETYQEITLAQSGETEVSQEFTQDLIAQSEVPQESFFDLITQSDDLNTQSGGIQYLYAENNLLTFLDNNLENFEFSSSMPLSDREETSSQYMDNYIFRNEWG
ncbi:4259_t:CDS:2 [Funneliformis caledonium]|uniref:4259_t:CDS:1 n=1 Tax=Funneliformis caledonium TaxID=1117310 RepID=A0A9N8W5V1_9GLOM|nr:4259_t:CDS:2 [Funneliformis caledonium]